MAEDRSGKGGRGGGRQARQAAALRENLGKRRAQRRARGHDGPGEQTPPSAMPVVPGKVDDAKGA